MGEKFIIWGSIYLLIGILQLPLFSIHQLLALGVIYENFTLTYWENYACFFLCDTHIHSHFFSTGLLYRQKPNRYENKRIKLNYNINHA